MSSIRRKIGYAIQIFKAKLGILLLGRASRKQKGPFDRFCTWLLSKIAPSSRSQSNHFMKDDLVDEDIEFDPKELARYQQPSSEME